MSGAKGAAELLIGTWKSDADLSMSFNKKNAVLKKKHRDMLKVLLGRMELTYTADGRVISTMPDTKLKKQGDMQGFSSEELYTVLFESESRVMIQGSIQHDISGRFLYTIYFVDKDTYWIYLGDDKLDIHAREYFTRVKKGQSAKVKASKKLKSLKKVHSYKNQSAKAKKVRICKGCTRKCKGCKK